MQAEPSSYTVAEFCEAERISRSMFYTLQGQAKARRVFPFGFRFGISREARRKGRADREAETEKVTAAVARIVKSPACGNGRASGGDVHAARLNVSPNSKHPKK